MKPQAPAVHAATPLVRNVWRLRHTGAGGVVGHAWHDVPHDATSTSETQRCPHACWPVGHWHWFALQVAPVGQSADLRQPGVHWRVTTSQPKPGGQKATTVQSLGSTWQVPRLHACPFPHPRPHWPQLSTSDCGSTHRPAHDVSVPAHPPAALPPAVPPAVPPATPPAVPPATPPAVPPPTPTGNDAVHAPSVHSSVSLHALHVSPLVPHSAEDVVTTHAPVSSLQHPLLHVDAVHGGRTGPQPTTLTPLTPTARARAHLANRTGTRTPDSGTVCTPSM
jgi:hypothetical protein